MKIALITDQHFDVRNSSLEFFEYFMEFYNKIFFPTLKEREIEHVIQCGDLFDKRKYINFNILAKVKKEYFDVLSNNSINVINIIGNHCVYFNNTNSVNSPSLILNDYDNIENIRKPVVKVLSNKKCLFLPWINKENYEEVMMLLEDSYDYCFSHLELKGFLMHKGVYNNSPQSMDSSLLKNCKQVFSGHFHIQSKSGNIQYLGTPYEITWNDYDEPKGFHILDLSNDSIEFIKNPYSMFHKIYYNDQSLNSFDFEQYRNRMVKVIIKNKKNYSNYELLIDRLNQVNPLDLTIIEKELSLNESIDLTTTQENVEMKDVFNQVIQESEMIQYKTEVNDLITTLHNEVENG